MPGRAAAGKAVKASARKASNVLLDTGVLVALHNRADPLHGRATTWLAGFTGQLHSVEPVLGETAGFLPPHLRPALAELAAAGMIRIHHPDHRGFSRIAELLRKYESLDPDWADAALVWLAEHSGIRRIATVDITDFTVYRIHGRTRFELELLR